MTVEVIYRVRNRQHVIVEETVDKKTADLIDQRLTAVYEICDWLRDPASPFSSLGNEQEAERLAEHLMDHREWLMSVFKKVKDLPAGTAERSSGKATPRHRDEAA